MRIGIEAQRIFRPKKHGMDIVALELIHTLQRIDKVNQYFIFVKPDEDDTCIKETENFKIVRIPGGNYVYWEQILLPKELSKYKLDLIHCTNNTAPLFCKTPIVLTLHDVIFLEKNSGGNGGTAYQKYGNMYRKYLLPLIFGKCRKVLTISTVEQANISRALNVPKEQVTVVHNGVSQRFGEKPDAAESEKVKAKFNLPEKFFFFLGNKDPRKNVPNVINAFIPFTEKYPEVKLVITALDAAMVTEILEKSGKSALIDRFIFPGYVSNNELTVLYHQAFLFLYPSLREGFGLPILEAMSAGTPVLTSNVSSMPEVAGDAAFLVNPESVESITEGIFDAFENETKRAEKMQGGYLRPPLFTWENTAKKMLEIYREIQ